jgi:hypothetical protein
MPVTEAYHSRTPTTLILSPLESIQQRTLLLDEIELPIALCPFRATCNTPVCRGDRNDPACPGSRKGH